MAEEEFQERTEKATPRHKEEARKKGQVARSVEVGSVAVLLFALLALYFYGPAFYQSLAGFTINTFNQLSTFQVNLTNLYTYLLSWILVFGKILAPLLLVLTVVGLLSHLAQVGVLFSWESITPKIERLNPAKGFKRLLSRRALFDLIKNSIKVIVIGYVAYITIKAEFANFVPLGDAVPSEIFAFAAKMSLKVGIRVCLSLLILALLDYGFQRWEYERDLRMTRQEVKEEYKQYEGDPLIKARVRRIQREVARRRMMQEVPEADVVITNPVEIAVALKYDEQTMNAPTVIAKGERLLAERIKEIAIEHKVPIVENKPLAQALFKAVEIGMEIPANLYKAVAEVLAYVYRLRGKI